MTQQEWEVLNSTMGYSPQQDTAIRKSVQQATANGATVPPGYQNLLPSVASWMPGEEQSSIFNSPDYGEVDAFGYDAIDSASTGVLDKYSSEVNNPSSNVNKVQVKKHNADGTVTTTTTENKTNTPSFKGTKDKDKDKMRVPMTNAGGMTVIATSPEEVAMYQNNGYTAPNTEMGYPEVGSDNATTAQGFNDWRNEYNSRPELAPSQFFDNPMIDTDAMGNPIQDQTWYGNNVNKGVDRTNARLNNLEGIDPNDDYYEGYIPSNDSLEGNYYGDEAAMVGDSAIFDQAEFGDTEWGGYNTTPKTMYHPSGFSQVINEPEAPLFIRDGYFNTQAEATEDRDAQTAFDKAEAGQDFFNNQWDAEEASLANIPSWLGTSKGPMTDAEREAANAKKGYRIGSGYTADLINDYPNIHGMDDIDRHMKESEHGLAVQDPSGSIANDPLPEGYDPRNATTSQTFDWQGESGSVPIIDKDLSSVAKDYKEVAKSEVGQAVVKEFQQRVAAGSNPDAEVKRFLQSAAPLKEWRPKLFKAILGTLVGLAGGDSIGAAGQMGFGAVGEDIAAEEKVAAEIAKEERDTANKIAVEREKLGLKAIANKAKVARESVEKGEAFAFKMVDKLRATLPTDKKSLYEDIDASKVIGGLGKLGSLYPSINWFQPQSQVVSQARMQGLSEWAAYVKKSVNSGNTAKTPPESFIEAQFVRNKYVGTFGKEGKKKITIPRSYFGNDVEQTIKTANVVNTEWAMAKSSGVPAFNNAGFSQEAMWRLYAANFQAYLKTAEGKSFNKKYKTGGFEKWIQQNHRGYIIK
jgi:hypothetical protein